MPRVTYAPTQKVNIGIGKDDVNDFARKYNLEIEAVYDILNRHNARAVVFYSTSDYWSQTDTGYKLSLPHNGNVVFAVYRTDSANESTQVLTGVKQDATNVEIESLEKFDGFMLYGAMNPEKGIGYNTEDWIVDVITELKDAAEAAATTATDEAEFVIDAIDHFMDDTGLASYQGQQEITQAINALGVNVLHIKANADTCKQAAQTSATAAQNASEYASRALTAVRGASAAPVGTVLAYAGSTAPDEWLVCDGSAVSRTTYADLFDVIGTTYGAGNGSTTFNLPDLSDKFVEGSGTNDVGDVMSAGLPNITGSFNPFAQNYSSMSGSTFTGAFDVEDSTQHGYSSSSTDNDNVLVTFDASDSNSIYGNSDTVQPPAVAMLYIIKWKAYVPDSDPIPIVDPTLTISGAAADSKVVGDKVTDLKSEIDNEYINNPPTSQGGFSSNGVLNTTNPRRIRTEMIPVQIGDKIVIDNGSLKHSCGAWNGTPSSSTNVRNDLSWITEDETIVSEINGFYVVQFAKIDDTQYLTPAEFDGYIHLFANAIYRNSQKIATLQTDVETLGESVSSAVTKVDVPVYDIIPTEITKSQGYYGANNSFSNNASYEHTQIITVEVGDIITPVSANANMTFRFVTAYKDGTCITSAGSGTSVSAYTVPDGINGVRFSFYVSQNITGVSIKRQTGTETVYYPISQKLGYINWKGDLASGQSVELPGSNVRFNTVWNFTGHITTMGKLTLGVKTPSGTLKELCSVDSTNLYYRLNNGNTASVSHGLTISEDLQIKIESPFKVNELGGITICSDGIEYTLNVTAYGTDMSGSPCLVSDGAVMTDCAFSWIPKDIDKPIWVFGDSWVSMFDTRWVYYMVRDGYVNSWMLNGFAGEDTDEAYDSLLNLLTIRKPEYIVWLLGMNNGDSTTAVNTVWKTIYDKLVQLCNDYKINLILYTVPNTPTINNNFKNAIVRESGYRYIDGASAVGDDGNGNWFTGFEQSSTDHNHTSSRGARALYYRILADFPEIAGNGI